MIDKSSPMPLYAQVKAYILEKINSGKYREGEKLPTEFELTKELGVGRVTVRTALAELESEGRIEKKHGVGTFVAERKLRLTLEPILSLSYMIDKLGLPADTQTLYEGDECAKADFLRPYWQAGDIVHHVKRLRNVNETTYFIDDNYFARDLYHTVVKARGKAETPTHAFFAADEVTVEKITHDIYLRLPTPEEKELLHLPDEMRVVVLDRWLFSQGEREPLSFVKLVIGEKYLAMPLMH